MWSRSMPHLAISTACNQTRSQEMAVHMQSGNTAKYWRLRMQLRNSRPTHWFGWNIQDSNVCLSVHLSVSLSLYIYIWECVVFLQWEILLIVLVASYQRNRITTGGHFKYRKIHYIYMIFLWPSDLYNGNPNILTLKQVFGHHIKPDGNAFLILISKMAMQVQKQQPPQVKHMTKLFALAHTMPIAVFPRTHNRCEVVISWWSPLLPKINIYATKCEFILEKSGIFIHLQSKYCINLSCKKNFKHQLGTNSSEVVILTKFSEVVNRSCEVAHLIDYIEG